MPGSIYVNLIVGDLPSAINFFSALGFNQKPGFSNEDAAGLQVNNNIFAMLHTEKSIKRYTDKFLVDSHKATEVLLALQMESRAEVDDFVSRAIEAGGREYRDVEDHGFMYARSFEDLDGHIWESFWMDADGVAKTND